MWYIEYTTPVTGSHFTANFGSTDPDAMTPLVSVTDGLRTLFFGSPGTPAGWVETVVYIPTVIFTFFIVQVVKPHFAFMEDLMNLFLPLLALGVVGVAAVLAGLFWWLAFQQRVAIKRLHGSLQAGRAARGYAAVVLSSLLAAIYSVRTFVAPRETFLGNSFDATIAKQTFAPADALFWNVVGALVFSALLCASWLYCLGTLAPRRERCHEEAGTRTSDATLL